MIYQIFTEEVVRALGWTVLHSLWQAALVALLLAGLQLGMSGARAYLRYHIANGALLLVLALAIGTFAFQYNKTPSAFDVSIAYMPAVEATQAELIAAELAAADMAAIAPAVEENPGSSHWSEVFWSYFDEHLPLIATLWLMGMVFFLLRLLGGLAYIQQLRSQRTQYLPEDWELVLEELRVRLNLRIPVQLLESAKVLSPIVIGHFKPIILLPVGLVNQLSVDQVEAVLAHELAHIARHDYLWNILQSVVEVLLYFNPAVWWIAGVVRNERENCCDDIAVQISGDSLVYAHALVRLQEIQHSSPRMAMALAGNRRYVLLNRIRRILNQPQQKSNTMQKFAFTCLLLLVVGVMSIGASRPGTQDKESAAAVLSAVDSLPTGKIRLNVEHKGQKVEARLNEGKITYLKIDEKEVPAEEFNKYEDMVVDIMSDIPAPPPPPAPPAPPAPGSPVSPPAPPAPPAFNWGAPAPPAVAPRHGYNFSYHSLKNITTEKDKEGNTVIIIEGEPGEKAMKIEVDGETGVVLMDGEPLDPGKTAFITEGEALAPLFFENGAAFISEGGTLKAPFIFQGGDISWAESPEVHAFSWPGNGPLPELEGLRAIGGEALDSEARVQMERAMEEYRRAMEDYHRSYKDLNEKQKKELEAAMRQQEKAMREMERGLQRREAGRHAIERDMHRQAIELERQAIRLAEIPAIHGQLDHGGMIADDLESIIEHELMRDNLIKDNENYKLELTGNSLKVNGKKQPESLQEKYEDLYEDFSGFDLSDKSKIVINKKQ